MTCVSPEFPEFFVIRNGKKIFSYVNSCPHTNGPLNWNKDKFLDPSGSFIQCSTHGARFRIEDGYCVSGPCKGSYLTPISVKVDGGELILEEKLK